MANAAYVGPSEGRDLTPGRPSPTHRRRRPWTLAALLLALGQQFQHGQLPRRAVPAYNLLHHPVVPTLVLAAALTGLLGTYWVVAALAWAAHICIDWAAGYGLRTADGWQRA